MEDGLHHHLSTYHPPAEEQVQHYHQRNFVPSHLYRVGVKLFRKKAPVRQRVIDTSSCWVPSANRQVPHPIMATRIDKVQNVEHVTQSQNKSEALPHLEYKSWLAQRREMRKNLESMGAHEQWLAAKECTPIEATLLVRLREERRLKNRVKTPPTPTETSDSDDEELSPAELKMLRLRERKQLLKDVQRLEKFLTLSRSRLAGFLIPYDTKKNYLIPTDIILECLERLRAPVSGQIVGILCEVLEKETAKEHFIDYRWLFKTGLVEMVEKYLQEMDELQKNEMAMPLLNGNNQNKESSLLMSPSDGGSTTSIMSTLGGCYGELAKEVKKVAQKQFISLLEYCQLHNIVLDKALAEKALLLPPDKTRKQCLQHLRQPGTDLPSKKIVEPPTQKTEEEEDIDLYSIYGWQYKQLRGPLHPKLIRLSTGLARVKAKTDSWLTYNEFQELTKDIQSRPGFNYKYHGLPSNSAFWPGALQDKLRLYLPHETLETKPYSLYNLFQPVQHPKVYNYSSTSPSTKGVLWPENESGHVQLGSSLARTRKTYIL